MNHYQSYKKSIKIMLESFYIDVLARLFLGYGTQSEAILGL